MVKAAPGWMFQVDNAQWTWTDTGVVVPAASPYRPRQYVIDSVLDYERRQSAIVAVTVDEERRDLSVVEYVPARQEGWAPMEIVTQLQQCVGGGAGGYTLRFANVGYDFSA